MKLKDYAQRNFNSCPEDALHGRLLDEIMSNPKLIGLPLFTPFRREVPLMDGGVTKARIDLVAILPDENYLVEAKVIRTGTVKGTKSHIESQLRRALEYCQEHFRETPRIIGVYKHQGEVHHYVPIIR